MNLVNFFLNFGSIIECVAQSPAHGGRPLERTGPARSTQGMGGLTARPPWPLRREAAPPPSRRVAAALRDRCARTRPAAWPRRAAVAPQVDPPSRVAAARGTAQPCGRRASTRARPSSRRSAARPPLHRTLARFGLRMSLRSHNTGRIGEGEWMRGIFIILSCYKGFCPDTKLN